MAESAWTIGSRPLSRRKSSAPTSPSSTLDGGAGSNALYGGAGDDVYLVNGTGDAVREFVAEGIDEVQTTLASYNLAANVARLVFVGSGAFNGTGNVLDNLIVGGTGDDTLTGGDGDDRLYFDAADALVHRCRFLLKMFIESFQRQMNWN